MKVPQTKLGQFFFFFFAQFLSYFLIVANTRAYTHDYYVWTVVSDSMLSAQSFLLGKLAIENIGARGLWAFMGTFLGGASGSVASIFLTKKVY